MQKIFKEKGEFKVMHKEKEDTIRETMDNQVNNLFEDQNDSKQEEKLQRFMEQQRLYNEQKDIQGESDREDSTAFRFAEQEMGDSGSEHNSPPADLAAIMSSKDAERQKISDARLKGLSQVENKLPKKGDMTEI